MKLNICSKKNIDICKMFDEFHQGTRTRSQYTSIVLFIQWSQNNNLTILKLFSPTSRHRDAHGNAHRFHSAFVKCFYFVVGFLSTR